MPMDPQQRAEAMRKFTTGQTPNDALIAKSVGKEIPRLVKTVQRALKRMDQQFQRLSGADNAAKQTQMFDAISAETDGSLILHDIAQILDSCLSLANTHKQPNDPDTVLPFTDADVDAYEV